MGKINAFGYMRIHTGLFSNTLSFGCQEEAISLGEALIQFVYADIKDLLDRTSYKIDSFEAIHPYFKYCDDNWKDNFINNLTSPEKDNSYYLIPDLIELQDQYKSYLENIYATAGDPDSKKILKLISSEEGTSGLLNRSCYNQCSLTITQDEKCCIDYFVSSFEELLYLELIEMIRRKINVVCCKNCGRLFIPRRSNSDYCQRICSPDGKTCAEIGYAQTFSATVRNDDLLMAYTKSYKAHYARMTKPRKKAKNMTRDEFTVWYHEAKDKLNQARAGIIDPNEYKEWLKL